jgi:hypothetical protein
MHGCKKGDDTLKILLTAEETGEDLVVEGGDEFAG